MTETTRHFKAIKYLHDAIANRYGERADVFVGANNYLYWEEGDTDEKQAPDVYVAFGASNADRSSYKTWEEGGVAPQVIFEITSKSSRLADLATKKGLYEMLGVEEYYAFDPCREYISHGLRAFRLKDGAYQEVTPAIGGSTAIRVYSPRLDLDLEAFPASSLLRLYEPGSPVALRTYEEAEKATQEEKARADREAARADRLARRLAELGIDPNE